MNNKKLIRRTHTCLEINYEMNDKIVLTDSISAENITVGMLESTVCIDIELKPGRRNTHGNDDANRVFEHDLDCSIHSVVVRGDKRIYRKIKSYLFLNKAISKGLCLAVKFGSRTRVISADIKYYDHGDIKFISLD